MIYDKTQLALLNLTEAMIDEKRLWLIETITNCQAKHLMFYIDRLWLPFLIDIMDQYAIEINPGHINSTALILIKNV